MRCAVRPILFAPAAVLAAVALAATAQPDPQPGASGLVAGHTPAQGEQAQTALRRDPDPPAVRARGAWLEPGAEAELPAAAYRGRGSTDEAASFRCVRPRRSGA